MDLAPQIVERDAENGKQLLLLEEANLEKLLDAGWTTPERFEARGRDGETTI